jgi:hypothetical protein
MNSFWNTTHYEVYTQKVAALTILAPGFAVVGSTCGVNIGAERQYLHHKVTLPRQIPMNLLVITQD